MTQMPGMPGAAALFAISAAIMIAMMLPSAVLQIARRGAMFGTGYVLVWTAFSAAATLVQYELDRAGLLSETMSLRSVSLAAFVIAGAGLYQLSPLKRTYLARCRISGGDRSRRSAQEVRAMIADGVRHGFSCVGCCWALMALPFAVGMLNIAGLVAIAAFIVAEKTVARRNGITKLAGVALVTCGALLPLTQ